MKHLSGALYVDMLWFERSARDKHFSLFGLFVSDEHECFITLAPDINVIILFSSLVIS
jgi:hypothetical protein